MLNKTRSNMIFFWFVFSHVRKYTENTGRKRSRKKYFPLSKVWHVFRPEYNTFLSSDRLSGKNDVILDKVIFKSDIRQNLFLRKDQNIKSLEQFGATVFWKIPNLGTCPSASNRTSFFKGHLVAFPLTLFAYSLKLNLPKF